MNPEIEALVNTIIDRGKALGMNKSKITSKAGMPVNKLAKIVHTDPHVSTLIRLGQAVGLKLIFAEADETRNAINNREAF